MVRPGCLPQNHILPLSLNKLFTYIDATEKGSLGPNTVVNSNQNLVTPRKRPMRQQLFVKCALPSVPRDGEEAPLGTSRTNPARGGSLDLPPPRVGSQSVQ